MSDQGRKDLARDFRDYMIRSSLPSVKAGLIFTLVLFALFALINAVFFRNVREQQLFIRFGIIVPFIILSLVVFQNKIFRKNIEVWLIIINLSVALSVFMIGAFADFTIEGYSYFYAWTMLVIIGTAVFYRVRMWFYVLVSGLLVLAYTLATVMNGTLANSPLLFTNNLFFVISLATMGYFIVLNLYALNRRNFLHHKALEKNYRELLSEIKERNKVENVLKSAEKHYVDTLNTIPDAIFVIDREGNILLTNTALRLIQQRIAMDADLTGQRFDLVFPFISKETAAGLMKIFETREISFSTEKMRIAGQDYITDIRKIPIFKNNQVHQVMAIIRDVTKEKAYEDLKLKNAEQKELLLREIHHRVKNNLAIVISMLSLQTRSNPDPVLAGIIQDIELRIRSMALIHEHLYRSENLDRIPLADYLQSLSAIIASTFQRPNVSFQNQLEPMDANIEAALPIGLITNELLTNAFKYAFPEGKKGTIKLSLYRSGDDAFIMEVADDGVGLPAEFSFDDQTTLGMFMVRLLVEQLNGKLEILNNQGSTFRITITHKLM